MSSIIRIATRISLAALIAVAAPVAVADKAEQQLLDVFDEFLAASANVEGERINECLCLDWMVAARMGRAADLGLVEPGTEDQARTQYVVDYRLALSAFIDAHDISGAVHAQIDLSRVLTFDGAEVIAVPYEGGEQVLPIMAAGILAVQWSGRPGTTDIPVLRLGERWCLNPVSL